MKVLLLGSAPVPRAARPHLFSTTFFPSDALVKRMHPAPALLVSLLLAIPAVGAAAASGGWTPADVSPEGLVPVDLSLATPLRADTPSGYTPEIHRKVLHAATRGLAYDPVEDREVPLAADLLFIRPGAWMWSPSLCTMGFVHGSPGSYKMSTAGHCTSVGQDVVIVAHPGVFVHVGRTSASHNSGVGDDWALVDISASMQRYVDTDVPYWGGPEGGSYTGDGRNVLLVKFVGRGAGVLTPRAGAATPPFGPAAWTCACPAFVGDSGAPALAATASYPIGQALGLATHLVAGGSGLLLGTRVTMIPVPVANGDLNPVPTPLPDPLPSLRCGVVPPHDVPVSAGPAASATVTGGGSVCKGVQPDPMPMIDLQERLVVDSAAGSADAYVNVTSGLWGDGGWDYGIGICPGPRDEPIPCEELLKPVVWGGYDPCRDDPVRCPVSPAVEAPPAVGEGCTTARVGEGWSWSACAMW